MKQLSIKPIRRCIWEEGVNKKSMLCTLAKMLKIMDGPLVYFCVEIVCKCFVTETSPTTSDENTNEIALGTLLAISVVGLVFSLTVNVIVCIRLHRRKTRLCIICIYVCIKFIEY